jgi:outer membrane protein assembly factor BamA
LFALTPEDGVLLGAGPILYEFGFRTFPYVYRMQLVGGFSIPTGKFKFAYTLSMPSLSRRLSLVLSAHASEVEVRNFYGFGNDSRRDEGMENNDFYRVASREYFVQPTLYHVLFKRSNIGIGLSFKHFDIRKTSERSVAGLPADTLGKNRTQLGLGVNLVIDTRNHPLIPHRGFYMKLGAWNYPDPFKSRSPFQRIVGDIRFYIGDTLITDVMLAFRLAAEKVIGTFPFYEAAFLGGAGTLRGYGLQRFAGDEAAFGSAELRFSLFRAKLIVPTEVGLFLLADAGRVWTDGLSPGGVHSDTGVGIWLAPLNRNVILSFAGASSVDGLFVSGGVGFGF